MTSSLNEKNRKIIFVYVSEHCASRGRKKNSSFDVGGGGLVGGLQVVLKKKPTLAGGLPEKGSDRISGHRPLFSVTENYFHLQKKLLDIAYTFF